jgi:hypothetical protein
MSNVLLVAVAVVIGALGLAADGAAEERMPGLTVRLRNDANVSQHFVTPAREIVRQVFAAAGVDVVWEGASMVMVVLSAREPAELSGRVDVLGFATGTRSGRGRVAYVVMPRVREFTRAQPLNQAVLLGAAIAHEIGHLLLPHDSHSTAGLMQPTFAPDDITRARFGTLGFTAAQAISIRSTIDGRRRMALAQSQPPLHASFDAGFPSVEISPEHDAGQ